MKKINDQQVDDIVSLIDNFMSSNGGHINIAVNSEGVVSKEEIQVDNSLDCINGACKAPTLFEGLDEQESKED